VITIYENGEIGGIEDLSNLKSPDLLAQFVTHPKKFHEFIFQHWSAAYSSLFVYQLQPLTPEFPCCALHVVKATNGKGNNQTLEKFEEIAEILDSKGVASLAARSM
jgi:hypothetical protein